MGQASKGTVWGYGRGPRCEFQFSDRWPCSCMLCLVPHYPGSVSVPPRALGQGGPYTLQVLYCDVLRCQAAEAGPGYKNACVVVCVSEGTLRTGTSMLCTIQWLCMCPKNSRFRSCNYFDDCSVMQSAI